MPDLLCVYERLYEFYGPQHWWPAETPFEVCVGAILTQSTAWRNVEKAVGNLKQEGLLSLEGLTNARIDTIARHIKPSLYYNIKARKLKEFVRHVGVNHGGDLGAMLDKPAACLRDELLGIWGVGPETADSIILYAAGKPSFVVDAYTKRIFERLGHLKGSESYDEIKNYFETNLPKTTRLYNEYHALIVAHAKTRCTKKPACKGCPLAGDCKFK